MENNSPAADRMEFTFPRRGFWLAAGLTASCVSAVIGACAGGLVNAFSRLSSAEIRQQQCLERVEELSRRLERLDDLLERRLERLERRESKN